MYLIVSLVFSQLGFWSGSLFLIAPFPDLCLLVLFCASVVFYKLLPALSIYMVLDILGILIIGKFNAELLDLFHRETLLKPKCKIKNSQMINVLIADRKLNSLQHESCFLIRVNPGTG